MQGVSKLLDFVAYLISLEDGCHDWKTIRQGLTLPIRRDALCDISKFKPESEVIGIPIIVPYTRSAIDAKFRDGAVPGEAYDMSRALLLGVRIRGISHILPALFELRIRSFRLAMYLIEDASALVRLKLLLVFAKRYGGGAGADVQIERRNPELFALKKLIDGQRKPAGAFDVELEEDPAFIFS